MKHDDVLESSWGHPAFTKGFQQQKGHLAKHTTSDASTMFLKVRAKTIVTAQYADTRGHAWPPEQRTSRKTDEETVIQAECIFVQNAVLKAI